MRKFLIGVAAMTAMANSVPAQAMTYFLTDQWYDNSGHFCKYGNGTILNVGFGKMCPMQING